MPTMVTLLSEFGGIRDTVPKINSDINITQPFSCLVRIEANCVCHLERGYLRGANLLEQQDCYC